MRPNRTRLRPSPPPSSLSPLDAKRTQLVGNKSSRLACKVRSWLVKSDQPTLDCKGDSIPGDSVDDRDEQGRLIFFVVRRIGRNLERSSQRIKIAFAGCKMDCCFQAATRPVIIGPGSLPVKVSLQRMAFLIDRPRE